MPRLAPLLVGSILLAACALPGSAGTFRAGDVTVIDESGLVTAVSEASTPADEPLPEVPRAARGTSLTQVLLSWSGSGCVEEWMVRLEGNALLTTIEPRRSADECQEPPIGRAVLLQLNRAVQAADIEVELRD